MRPDPADLHRHAVRPLLPGPLDALREAVLRLDVGAEALPLLARHAAAEALAVRGLSSDQARVLERELARLGGQALVSPEGDRAVLLGPLSALGELPARLLEWGRNTEPLGRALQAALASRGAPPSPITAGRHRLVFGVQTLVMGILNVTPDSFSGDGVHDDVGAAFARAEAMVEAGADIIDVGGESTRPGSEPVDAEEEERRVVPVVRALVERLDVPVSIDTKKAPVARAAIAAGAGMVNDVWGLRADPAMADVVAESGVALVAMHNQAGTQYGDLLEDIVAGLCDSLARAGAAGVPVEQVILDPGFGFGKTPEQNLELMRRLGELKGLGRPLMLGPSRKSTIGLILDGAPPEERVEGTAALCVLGVAAGIDLVRVHDVGAVRRAVRTADAVLRGTPLSVRDQPAPGATG